MTMLCTTVHNILSIFLCTLCTLCTGYFRLSEEHITMLCTISLCFVQQCLPFFQYFYVHYVQIFRLSEEHITMLCTIVPSTLSIFLCTLCTLCTGYFRLSEEHITMLCTTVPSILSIFVCTLCTGYGYTLESRQKHQR